MIRIELPQKEINLLQSYARTSSIGLIRDKSHEIMASPFKAPRGIIKLELLGQQYSELKVVPITEDFYKRLSKRFRRRVMQDPSFRGWETGRYHLYSNPEVFS